jgi:hypothetical protein
MSMKEVAQKIMETESLADLEFVIAEILIDKEDSNLTRNVVEFYASHKLNREYKIPNVNGMKRPLTKWEIEEIALEDRGHGRKRIF